MINNQKNLTIKIIENTNLRIIDIIILINIYIVNSIKKKLFIESNQFVKYKINQIYLKIR